MASKGYSATDFPFSIAIFLPLVVTGVLLLLLVSIASADSSDDDQSVRVDVGLFSLGELDGWERKSYKNNTYYELKRDVEKGIVLVATSSDSASFFGKPVQIDLASTPFLNWQWKIDNRLNGIDESTTSGDDFAARVYLVKTSGLFGHKSKAVNYVWSSNQPVGTSWDNAHKPDKSKMIAVRGVEQSTERWVTEKRNVAADFRKFFAEDINSVDLVVIMSDTDNTGLSVSASYGDIYFTSK